MISTINSTEQTPKSSTNLISQIIFSNNFSKKQLLTVQNKKKNHVEEEGVKDSLLSVMRLGTAEHHVLFRDGAACSGDWGARRWDEGRRH